MDDFHTRGSMVCGVVQRCLPVAILKVDVHYKDKSVMTSSFRGMTL